jgi:hypothetical protein
MEQLNSETNRKLTTVQIIKGIIEYAKYSNLGLTQVLGQENEFKFRR